MLSNNVVYFLGFLWKCFQGVFYQNAGLLSFRILATFDFKSSIFLNCPLCVRPFQTTGPCKVTNAFFVERNFTDRRHLTLHGWLLTGLCNSGLLRMDSSLTIFFQKCIRGRFAMYYYNKILQYSIKTLRLYKYASTCIQLISTDVWCIEVKNTFKSTHAKSRSNKIK